MCSKGKKSIWTGLCVWGQHYDETLLTLGRLRLGGHFETDFVEGRMESIQCNVDFGYRLCIFFGTEENDGKPLSHCRSFVRRSIQNITHFVRRTYSFLVLNLVVRVVSTQP